jgi:hypothetical protein
LNCGATLTDRFCAGCGQRMVPPYPTMREMTGDAWDEMVGYDGRFLKTLRVLLFHPGQLTNEVLQGRRARYLFPIRLYLVASVTYFLAAAIAPPAARADGGFKLESGTTSIRLDDGVTADERAKLLSQDEEVPAWLAPLVNVVANDPEGFSRSLRENTPRALFALVPFFAAVMKLFYRGGWVQHMTFSLHLHAAIFLMLVVREFSRFANNLAVLGTVEVLTLVAAIAHSLVAMRRVYATGWGRAFVKFVPIVLVYSVGYGIAVLGAIVWTVGW